MNNFDKILGGFTGLIAADMLAFPLKFEDFNRRKKFFPITNLIEPFGSKLIKKNILIKSELKSKLSSWFPAGFTSVNSQLPLLLASSIYELSDVDIEDISQKLVKYSFPRDKYSPLGIFRGHSKHLNDSIQNIIHGLPLKVCGTYNNIGNCIVSAIPLGLFYVSDPKSIRNKAIDLALMFNKDYQTISSACVIAYTSSLLVSQSNIDKNILLDIADFARQSEELTSKKYGDILKDSCEKIHNLSNAIKHLFEMIDQPLENLVSHYRGLKDVHINSSIPVTCISLHIVFNSLNDYTQAVRTAVESDIPIDLVAPIVGSLTGANIGYERIPPNYRKLVNNIETLETLSKYLKAKECKKKKIKNFFLQELENSSKQIFLKKIREKLIEKM